MKENEHWKEKLTPKQYKVMREKGTEAPFTSDLLDNKEEGVYKCAGCGQVLFKSDTKFESGTGWPSFYDVAEAEKVKLREDNSLGMERIEVICSNCGSHLGHLFKDGPEDKTGKRYCINGCALNFDSK